MSKYDIYFYSGGTKVFCEGKARDFKSTKYPDFKVSASKCDFGGCDDWWVIAYFKGDDRWFVWDLGKYKPLFEKDGYRHRKYTVVPPGEDNPIIIEDAWVFEFDNATLKGRLRNGA